MCGRYASSHPPELIAERFDVAEVRGDPLPPCWNVAPTTDVYAVLSRPAGRQLRPLRWGLVPSWAKDPGVGARMINARAETLTEKGFFKRALERRRCLVPADGYYEWLKAPGRSKQPFFIRRHDGEPLAFAGLWETWRDPAAPEDAPLLWSLTIVTTAANHAVRHIHDRMPLTIDESEWARWLGPEHTVDAVADLLVPAPAAVFEAYPVSPEVGSVRNDGPHLVEPLPAANEDAALFPLG